MEEMPQYERCEECWGNLHSAQGYDGRDGVPAFAQTLFFGPFLLHESQEAMPCKKRPMRGHREGLDTEQYVHLFKTLAAEAPWAAMMSLLQLISAERADCVRQARRRWLQNLDPRNAAPPILHIEKVNGKTKERTIPTPTALAAFLHGCLDKVAHISGKSLQWPFEGQPLSPDSFLFPGLRLGQARRRGGLSRVWEKNLSLCVPTFGVWLMWAHCYTGSAQTTDAMVLTILLMGFRSTAWAHTASNAPPWC